MKKIELDYGTDRVSVELPDSTVVVRYGETYVDPPTAGPVAATRAALDAPLGMPPLTELAGPGRSAVIVFPDRVKGGAHPLAHRRVSIPASSFARTGSSNTRTSWPTRPTDATTISAREHVITKWARRWVGRCSNWPVRTDPQRGQASYGIVAYNRI